MRRYSASGARFEGRPRGEAGITAQYLEAMDDDGDLAGDSDDGGGGADGLGVSASERARNALRRNLDVRHVPSSALLVIWHPCVDCAMPAVD